MTPHPVIAFDLGDTLVEYTGVPLNWESHYADALRRFAAHLGIAPTADQIDAAAAVLRRYNTRLHPRTAEVSFAPIAGELAATFDAAPPTDELAAATAFFQIFRQRLRCFPDTRPALDALRARGVKLGLFTDVPYGMPRELVCDDLRIAELADCFDGMLTSREVGVRKPAATALAGLARHLGCRPAELAYVGNERKDIEAAHASGCSAILVDRSHLRPAWGQDRTITSLAEL